jgi:hypothetical protein
MDIGSEATDCHSIDSVFCDRCKVPRRIQREEAEAEAVAEAAQEQEQEPTGRQIMAQ